MVYDWVYLGVLCAPNLANPRQHHGVKLTPEAIVVVDVGSLLHGIQQQWLPYGCRMAQNLLELLATHIVI